LIIYSVTIVGYFWSIADQSEINEILLKYLKLVLIPLLTVRFFFDKNNIRTVENTIIGTSLFIIIVPYLIFLGLLNDNLEIDLYITQFEISQTGAFKSHLITNIFLSVAGFFSTIRYLSIRDKKYLYISLIFHFYIFIVSDGLTGQIIAAFFLLLLFNKYMHEKIFLFKFLAFLFVISFIIPDSFINPSSTSSGKQVLIGISNYQNNEINNSLEHRLSLWHNGVKVFLSSPLFGYGTGSVKEAFILNLNSLMPSYSDMSAAENPHSELIFWLMQYGLLGFLVVLSVILAFLKLAINQPNEIIKVSQFGIILFLLVGSFGTSLIFDSGEGHFAIILLSAYFAD